MITSDLKNKWNALVQTENLRGYKSTIMSAKCTAEIYLGVNIQKKHCLILALPKGYYLDFNTRKKEKISITLYPKTNYLVLELHDNQYYDIFDDLIISLYYAIKNIEEVTVYTKKIIQMFNKWSEFFTDESSDSLSREEIKGLFGELYILEAMTRKSNASNIDDVLSSWRGPYNGPYDFVLDQKNIEIKTKSITKKTVNISSEYQLEREKDKNLELLVLSVNEDIIDGMSLREILIKIKNLTFEKSGDYSIILKALQQKNITQNNILEYDNYRYKAIEQILYSCDSDTFPKLIKSNTSPAISTIRYTLRLSYLEDFILSRKKYND